MEKKRSFLPSWYYKWTWLHYNEAEDSVYCIICKNADHYNMLNDVRLENSFIKTGYSNWKHARRTDKGFHQHESSNCHQQAIQRLIEIPKTTEDVSQMIKNNSTEVQSQNRVCLIKSFRVCVIWLVKEYLYVDMEKIMIFDPVFSEWLNRKNQNLTSPEIQNEIL